MGLKLLGGTVFITECDKCKKQFKFKANYGFNHECKEGA